MIFEATPLQGLILIRPRRAADERGYFMRTFCAKTFAEQGLVDRFEQNSESFNQEKGTLRGMHYQSAPFEETKLIRCTRGAAHDILVDIRPHSPTRYQHFAVDISAKNGISLYVPAGFAHGFQTLEDETALEYLITPIYQPENAQGLRFDDPKLAIQWPLPVKNLSERDKNLPLISDTLSLGSK